jgi:hypothetical protein
LPGDIASHTGARMHERRVALVRICLLLPQLLGLGGGSRVYCLLEAKRIEGGLT